MKNKVCIVVPIHKNYLELYERKSLENNKYFLNNYDFIFVAPKKLNVDIFLKHIVSKYNSDVLYFNNYYFNNIKGYNKLLISIEFYEKFKTYDFILICQLDAIVLSDKLEYWTAKNYDYIGAPWFIKKNGNYLINSSGNGGFSLRKTSKFIEILKSKELFFDDDKYFSTPHRAGLRNLVILKILNRFFKKKVSIDLFLFFYKGPEDYFWAFFAKFFSAKFKVASDQESLNFSFEEMPRECLKLNNNNLPFGCHAWQKYDKSFWENIIPNLKG